MIKIIIAIVACLAVTNALLPGARQSSRTLLKMSDAAPVEQAVVPDPAALVNIKSRSLPFMTQPPNIVGMPGDVGFDPLGFSNNFDVRWLREAELKHGRVCMLAVLGFVVSGFMQLPGEIHNVSPVQAHDVAVRSGAMGQILLWIGIIEALGAKAIVQMLYEDSGRSPGDYSFDPLGYSHNLSDAKKDQLAEKELNNGRLAMLAFSGIITQAVLTDKGFPYV